MSAPEGLKEIYNRIAEHWHSQHAGDTWWMPTIDKFVDMLPKGATVWDAGCATAEKSRYLIAKGMKVTGTDFSENMVELAKREAPAGEFFVSDIYDAASLGREFDGIVLQAVLLHVPKKEAAKVVQGIASRLKKGGYFYVAVKEKRDNGADEEIKTENDYGFSYQRFFSYFTMDEIKGILAEAGCEIVYEDIVPVKATRWVQAIGRKIK